MKNCNQTCISQHHQFTLQSETRARAGASFHSGDASLKEAHEHTLKVRQMRARTLELNACTHTYTHLYMKYVHILLCVKRMHDCTYIGPAHFQILRAHIIAQKRTAAKTTTKRTPSITIINTTIIIIIIIITHAINTHTHTHTHRMETTPLFTAAIHGRYTAVETLAELGADVNVRSVQGTPVLLHAAGGY